MRPTNSSVLSLVTCEGSRRAEHFMLRQYILHWLHELAGTPLHSRYSKCGGNAQLRAKQAAGQLHTHLSRVFVGANAVPQLLQVAVLVCPGLEHHVLGHGQGADLQFV